ncbi:Ig-like domain-containing protein [Ectopseudomonas khazarica]|uniref:Ig-like domain-containing protein n=1 Tax=Ectopseudomonas khazarica TaxID=2502979 RepID=UPI003B951F3A
MDGQLLANGQYVSSQGSGSGGSLLLRVDAIELGSEAKIQANGGGTNTCGACTYGGGGGGRIAVHFQEVDRATLLQRLQVRGGLSWNYQQGGAGTLYLNDRSSDQAELIIDNTSVDRARAAKTLLDLGSEGELKEKLTVNNANVELLAGQLGLVQAAGSHLLQRADLNVADLRLDAGLWNQAGFALSTSSYRFSGATLQLSGSFNQVVDELLVDNYTVELSDDRSWQKIRLINGGVITTPAASETFTQGITLTADEIEVDASSRIDVSAKGLIPGADVANYCGGSHGGLGGSYGGCQTNAVYGDYLAPVTFGMGGRRSGTSGMVRGGGALKLVARSLHLDGQLLANGEAYPSNSTAGGGAGGSLWVDTQVLLGSATTRIQANGGAGRNSGGSGGGGRIAIYYAGLQGFDVLSQISVAGGVRSGSATAAEQGSLHLENRVVSTAVAGADVDGSIGREINAFTVDFINAVDPETVTASAVALSGPQGAVAIQSITALNSVRYRFELESVLSDGLYELRVGPGIRSVQGRGMDQNGNGIEDEPGDVFVRQFVIDRQAPLAPVVTSPLVAPAINSINVRRVTLTGERESQTAILVNGVVQVALGNGAWTISDYVPVEGDSDLQIQARDAAGNLSPASVVKLSVDSTRPSFQQYSHGGSINTVPDSVWVRFVEAGSGLDFANSSLVLKRGNDLIAGQLSLEGNTLRLTPSSTLLEGQYSVAVSLKDRAGNLSTTTFSFTLDYTPPLAPVLAAYPAVTTVNVLRLSITKESGSSLILRNAAEQAVGSMSGGGTNWNWDINLVPGDNLFTLEQRDVAGNVSPRTSIQVRFDNEAPGPVLFSIDPQGSGTEVKLAWPNYDEVANGNDIQQYRIYSAVQPFTRVAEAQLTMTVPGGTRQAVVKNLPRAETRHFAVVAVDQQGLLVDELLSQAATPQDIQPPADASGFSVRSFEDRLELSWQASVNLAGDLSGYVLYVGEGGVQRIDLPLPALVDGLSYSLTGLAAGSAHPLRLVAVDGDGNESAGVRNPGITWLGNPQDLQLQALSNRFEAQWKAVQPSEWVSGYRLYVADEPFTSIQGMSPKAKVGVGQVSTSIGGLLNNKAYHVAVTVVNASGGENPQVQSLSVKPVADSDGPELTALTWHDGSSNQDIRAGGVLAQLGELRIQAKDESGIGRVELSLDGQPMGMATRAGDYYRQAWSLVQVADGPHQLQVSLYDTLDNQSQLEVAVQVELAPPAAPSLSLQSKASKTNAPQQVLIVRGQANSLAQISHNGSDLGDLVVLDGSGQAQVPLTLVEGDNQLTARLRYGSREQFGAASEPLRVNLDSALPDTPGSLQAIAKAQGIVNLSWAAVNGVSGYDLYAANQPFTSVTDAGVSKLNSKALTSSSYQHQTTADGTYYYRVSSVNTLGSQSALSVPQSVTADSTPPKVEEALYSSLGQVSGDGRFAPGRVDVRLRMSEALRNAPFFSLDVPQGASIPVRLTQAANDPLSYLGSFDLSAAVPSGLLYARVSAHDPVGNEGTEVVEGKTLRVDTQGPDLQQLSLLPESPVENLVDGNQGREVQVVLRLSKDPIALPELTPRLDGQALVSQPGPLALSLDAQSQPGAPIYTGRFRLPVDAGQQSVQLLSFDYRASDDLGNTSERILGRRDFQVYKGDLPPLDIPQGLSGKALSAGRVALSWKEVAEASAYQVYRRGDADSDFVALGRVREQAFEDNLPVAGLADGAYHYRVASIREHDDKEAVSLPSDSIKVDVLSQAPGAPTDLSIELNGAGIVLRWLAPEAGQVVSYNLYRANVGQDQPIDIEGLAPLQSDIPERIALDSRPSDVEHAYTVTAVDAAGNESAPATSVYLNAGLLPVRDLSVHLAEGQAPQLQWDHSGQDVVGYNVYAGTSSEKLNETLITSTSFVDHRVALPFSAERQYSVTAVDAQGVESLPHTLLLPALKAELRAEQKLERGVFNQLHYRVLNSGSVAVKRLRLRVDVSSEGQVKQHLSDYFDVGAGSVSEVAVVVAGYKDLPGVVPLSVEIVQAPQEGESVSIQRNETITAGENTLLVQLLPDEFTRGGSGSVRVRLENPSAIATELITARSNGNQVSDEMRLILEDLQGNVLASQSVKASVGNGLITVRDGRTVARVGGYDVLETGPFSIDVPVAAPDRVRVRLEADFLHYQTGLPGELKLGGLRSSHELSLVEAPYRGEITAISPEQVQAGDSVTIRGRALGRDDAQPLAGVALKLVLNVRGFEHVVSVNTDEQGVFEYVFDTASSDSGEYLLSLIHPSIQLRPQHGRFLVQGAAFSPASVNTSFPRNYEQTVTVVVEAGHDSPLANVRLEYVQPDGSSGLPTGLKVQQGGALNLIAKQRGNLTLRISGDNGAAESGLLDYRIVADGLERPIGQVRIQYKLVQAQPLVRVAPTQIRTGVSREAEQVEQVTLSNPGQDVLRNVRVSLLDEQGGAAPGWVSLRTAERLGDLPVSASQLIGVAFSPDAAVAEGDYYFTLRIESDNAPVANVPMSASVTQSGQGGVIFQVEDIYTGTLNEQGQRVLGLKGAKIKLQNRNVLSSEFSATTDDRGQVLLENIPAGEYSYRISAWDHDDLSGQLWIKPGVVGDERVFLMSKLVTVEWSVKEITVEDRYEIILNATFKTNVPTALVMIEPLSINLPMMRKGDVFQGELTLTNYGLIRADKVQASLPTGDARTRIEYLRTVPETLEAGDVLVVPYRIVALQSFDPDDELNGAAGCWSFNYQGVVNYESQCVNGQIIPGRANVAWSANGRTGSCGGGGGGSIGGGGASGWGGWGGSWGNGFIPRPTPLTSTKQCVPPPDCDNGNCGGGNGGGD